MHSSVECTFCDEKYQQNLFKKFSFEKLNYMLILQRGENRSQRKSSWRSRLVLRHLVLRRSRGNCESRELQWGELPREWQWRRKKESPSGTQISRTFKKVLGFYSFSASFFENAIRKIIQNNSLSNFRNLFYFRKLMSLQY